MDGVVKWGLKDGTCGNVGGNPGFIFDKGFDGGGSGHPEQKQEWVLLYQSFTEMTSSEHFTIR